MLEGVVTANWKMAMLASINLEQDKGLSLYMLKAVMSGSGDEMIEILHTQQFALVLCTSIDG